MHSDSQRGMSTERRSFRPEICLLAVLACSVISFGAQAVAQVVTSEDAEKMLAESRRGANPQLVVYRGTRITKQAAKIFATYPGNLRFDEVTALSPAEALGLAKHVGRGSGPDSAARLSGVHDSIDLPRMTELSAETAAALSERRGGCFFLGERGDGIQSLDEEAAAALASFRGRELRIKVRNMSQQAQASLAQIECPLFCYGLAELTSTALAKKLVASRKGESDPVNIDCQAISDEVCAVLCEAASGRRLAFPGLASVSEKQAALLAAYRGTVAITGPVMNEDGRNPKTRDLLKRATSPRPYNTTKADRDIAEAKHRQNQEQVLELPSVDPNTSPWRVESDTGLAKDGDLIDSAIASALGRVSNAFQGRAYRGVTLREKYRPLNRNTAADFCLLPVEVPKVVDGERPATLLVLVDSKSDEIIGIFAQYQEPISAVINDVIRVFGKSDREIAARRLHDGSEEFTIAYTFPETVVRVCGNEKNTRVVVHDRKYVEQSLRPFANAVLSGCRWAKKSVRMQPKLNSGQPLVTPLAGLQPEASEDGSEVLMRDMQLLELARKRDAAELRPLMGWDVAAVWCNAENSGAVINFVASPSVGMPRLVPWKLHHLLHTLPVIGSCAELFHDVGDFLIQHEFPPAGEKISVLNAKCQWTPDGIFLPRLTPIRPSAEPNALVFNERVEGLRREATARYRTYQWVDEDGRLISFTESFVLSVTKQFEKPPKGL
jgi:hypothetical protein